MVAQLNAIALLSSKSVGEIRHRHLRANLIGDYGYPEEVIHAPTDGIGDGDRAF
jgi:hypothetical protein